MLKPEIFVTFLKLKDVVFFFSHAGVTHIEYGYFFKRTKHHIQLLSVRLFAIRKLFVCIWKEFFFVSFASQRGYGSVVYATQIVVI